MVGDHWNRDPPPGFRGLDPHIPVSFYTRHLLHWRQDGATCFVTFRLADSFPQNKLHELESLKREWLAKLAGGKAAAICGSTGCVAESEWEALARIVMCRIESWLDQGMGACHLSRLDAAQAVAETLHHFDGGQYELGCYVIMPNHVHAVLRPLHAYPLEAILQSRKRRAARMVNAVLGRRGSLWQEESFDRIVRDEEHLWRCVQYVGANPAKAGLRLEQCLRWVRPSWTDCGWGFDQPL